MLNSGFSCGKNQLQRLIVPHQALERGQAQQVIEFTEINSVVHCRPAGLPLGTATTVPPQRRRFP